MSELVDIGNDECVWKNSDYFKYGQHLYKMSGSCGFVNYPLITKDTMFMIDRYHKRKKTD